MNKANLFSTLFILLITLSACMRIEATETVPTPKVLSPEEELAEEELGAQVIATAYAKQTQIASRISPYVKLSDGEKRYLAFWFLWNDETVFLPLNEILSTDPELVTCQLDRDTVLAIGKLISGSKLVDDKCVPDEKALENAVPIIRIPRYFEDGLQIIQSDEPDAADWNIIGLNGEYAENLADIVTFVIENDLFGSGDLTLSLYRTGGPNGAQSGDTLVVPTYVLPDEVLQMTFSSDQLGNFEAAEDIVFTLERVFTWKIPAGFSILDLSSGDENWFVLRVREMKAGDNQIEEYMGSAYIQIKGVGASAVP